MKKYINKIVSFFKNTTFITINLLKRAPSLGSSFVRNKFQQRKKIIALFSVLNFLSFFSLYAGGLVETDLSKFDTWVLIAFILITIILFTIAGAIISISLGFIGSLFVINAQSISGKKLLSKFFSATLFFVFSSYLIYSRGKNRPIQGYIPYLFDLIRKTNPYVLIPAFLIAFSLNLFLLLVISQVHTDMLEKELKLGVLVKGTISSIKELTLGKDFSNFWKMMPLILVISTGLSLLNRVPLEVIEQSDMLFNIYYATVLILFFFIFPLLLQFFENLLVITKRYVLFPMSTERIYKRGKSRSARLTKKVVAFVLLFSAWLIFHSHIVFFLETLSKFIRFDSGQFMSIWDASLYTFSQMSGVDITIDSRISPLTKYYTVIIGASSIAILIIYLNEALDLDRVVTLKTRRRKKHY